MHRRLLEAPQSGVLSEGVRQGVHTIQQTLHGSHHGRCFQAWHELRESIIVEVEALSQA